MPPKTARQLDQGSREKLLAYLRDRTAVQSMDVTLQRAAQLGMAGGVQH
jgi:hypothetical protein